MVAAVVVTYNRKAELKKNLDMLYGQTLPPDRIFVVDNCSTDGTKDMLDAEGYTGKPDFVYVKTEANIGGAGGFYTGIRRAYDEGAEYIILMDDDGRPCNPNTFAALVDYTREQETKGVAEGRLFINALVVCGDLLTCKIYQMTTVKEAKAAAIDGILEGAAHPFNGTLITRRLVEAIGYPNKEFFIRGDEVDYKHRAFAAGAYVATVATAEYYHPRTEIREKVILGKLVPVCVEAPWKEYYIARNFTYMYRRQKAYKMLAFEIIFVKVYAILTMKCKKWKSLRYLCRGLKDGWFGRLGVVVRP